MASVVGLEKLLAGFKEAGKRHAKGVERGLKKAGLFLQRESMLIVPVETGLLRSGAFTRSEGSGLRTIVIVGYRGAYYAIWVHEDLTKAHGQAYNEKYAAEIARGEKTSRGPNQQAKYLTDPLRKNYQKLGEIVKTEASLG